MTFRTVVIKGTWRASADEWHKLADFFEQVSEPRLAKAIRAGVARRDNDWRRQFNLPMLLQFRDGSVDKIKAAITMMGEMD